MKPTLKFVIPVRHPENSRNWSELKHNLAATIKSVAAQTNSQWTAVIAANRGSDLPELPPGFSVVWVDFPPNPVHERGDEDKEVFFDGVRLDKGRRIYAGMRHAPVAEYTMILDDDDLVSRELTAFVAENRGGHGWFIGDGYIWSEGSKFMLAYSDFSNLCGSSHIVRTDLFALPEPGDSGIDGYIKRMLGSHIFMCGSLAAAGTPLARLPFAGAVYRVGHAGSHSKSSAMWTTYFFNAGVVKRPRELLYRIANLRFLSAPLRQSYFG